DGALDSARVSAGTFCRVLIAAAWLRACALAIAGEASSAATPTAERISFKFDVMFNLLFMLLRCAVNIAPTAPHKTLLGHEIVPANIVFMLILHGIVKH